MFPLLEVAQLAPGRDLRVSACFQRVVRRVSADLRSLRDFMPSSRPSMCILAAIQNAKNRGPARWRYSESSKRSRIESALTTSPSYPCDFDSARPIQRCAVILLCRLDHLHPPSARCVNRRSTGIPRAPSIENKPSTQPCMPSDIPGGIDGGLISRPLCIDLAAHCFPLLQNLPCPAWARFVYSS